MQPGSSLKSDEIILAKLTVPELPTNYVRRPYLYDQFRKGMSRRVIFVSSPVGFGKTTLLTEWYQMLSEQKNGYKTSWLTLDNEDSGSFRFWKHLLASLNAMLPDIDENDPYRLLPSSYDDNKEELSRYKIRLSNYLHQNALSRDEEYVLFLDNIDSLSLDAFKEVMNYFLAYFPPNFHVVTAGYDFPTDALDYQYLSSIYEFPTVDLAFSRQELMSFMANRYGNAASEQVIRELYDTTQGWITGIRLFTDAVEPHELRYMRTLDEDILFSQVDKYFSSYVIRQLDEDYLQFIVKTSILDKMNYSLCDYLLNRNDSKEIIADLVEKTFFVKACYTERGCFEYHPLFLRWLRTRLMQMRAPQIRELASRAQDWYELNTRPFAAAKYMLMASDADMIDNLAAAAQFMRDDPNKSFAAWICSEPIDRFPHDATLSLYVTWGYLVNGRADDTLHWLSIFEDNVYGRDKGLMPSMREEDMPPVDLVIEHVKIKCREFNGHYKECIVDYKKLLEAQPTISLSLRVLILHAIAESYERLGEFGLALEYYLQTEAVADLAQAPFFVAFGRYAMSWILARRGELQNAEVTCNRALNDCPPDFTLFGALHALLAFILIEKNELEEADKHIKQAARQLSLNRNADMLFESQVVTAGYTAAIGNLDEAYRQIVRTILLLEHTGMPRAILQFAYYTQAKIALQRNNINELESIHRKLVKKAGSSDLYYVLCAKQIEAYLMFFHGCEEALQTINEVIQESEEENINTITLEGLLLKATILDESGKRSEAILVLNKAIQLGSRLDLMKPFLDNSDFLKELLHEVMNIRKMSGAKYSFLKNILKALKVRTINDEPVVVEAQDDSGLTKREIEVLDLLNVGMSRQEIADALGVSHNTIKTHLNNIYSKLGVKNRSEVFKLMQVSER